MPKTLLLVDFENRPKLDMSELNDNFHAIVFVGANQNPPKAASKKTTAHKFKRVEFQRIAGTGKNALDFHIAFHLGRMFETDPDTACIVVAGDKGYDPLILHVNQQGRSCRRVDTLDELQREQSPGRATVTPEPFVCPRCHKAETIEHHGGRWCSNCGSFASPPDPQLLPSLQPGYVAPRSLFDFQERDHNQRMIVRCGWCDQPMEVTDGIYDDGEWMCSACVGG